MKLLLQRPGRPGDRLGVYHTLKHYLAPTEVWQDLAGGVHEPLRPLALLDRIGPLAPPPHDQAEAPGATLREHWPVLSEASDKGWGAAVRACAAEVPDPRADPDRWVERDKSETTWITWTPRGLMLEVCAYNDDWVIWTAFRPFDFKLKDPRCQPRDARSVLLRGWMAESAAYRRFKLLGGRRNHDDA